jgi:hydrogenase maturation protease
MFLVVGCGNPLREDDGVAFALGEALRAAGAPAEVIILHQLVPELALRLTEAEGVVFIDARQGDQPGTVSCVPVDASGTGVGVTHVATPGALLAYTAALCGRRPRAVLVTVAGERFAFGETLSPVVRAAVPEAVRVVLAQLATWGTRTT